MALDGKIVIGTKVDEKGLNTGLNSVSRTLAGFTGAIAGLGIGAALTKEFSEVVKATQGFEQGIAKASTLFGDVVVDMKNLKTGLRDISASTGADMGELGEAVYNAMSAGIAPSEDMAEVLQLVEKSSKLAKGGFTDVDTALSATVKTMNAYGEGIESTDRIMKVLMQTQNLGITTVGELGASLSQVIPTAAAFGVSFEEVGAALSVMTAAGTSTAMSTTQLNSLFAELGKSGTNAANNLSEAAKMAGLSATSFSDLVRSGYDLPQILELMSKYADQSGQSMLDMFSSIEAGKAALSLTGESAGKFATNLEKMSAGADMVETAFQKVVRPTERVKNAITSLRIELGDKFADATTNATSDLADFLEKLGGTRTEIDDFDEAMNILIKTSKDYADAVVNAKDAQDDLTKSIEATSFAAFMAALTEVGRQYDDALEAVHEAERQLYGDAGLEAQIRNRKERLQELAGVGNDIVETYVEFKELERKGGATGAQREFIALYEGYVDLLKEVDVQTDITQNRMSQFEGVVERAARAVMDGTANLSDFSAASLDLGNDVAEAIDRLEKQDKAVASAQSSWAEYSDKTDEELKTLQNRFTANAESYAEGSEKRIYWMTLASLAEKELTSRTKQAEEAEEKKAETEKIAANNAELYTQAQLKIRKAIDEVVFSAATMQETNDALGEEYYSQTDILQALEDGYVSLIRSGIEPTDEYMQTLLETIIEMRGEVKATEDENKKYADAVQKVLDKQEEMEKANTFLGISFYSTADQITYLEGKYEKLIKSGVDPASEGMLRLKETLKELNEEAAKETFDAWSNGLIEFGDILGQTFETIASGGNAWNTFARAGLTAIAKIVESLGHELTALAAASFLEGDWSEASLGTVKALAAYSAAGLIRGWAGSFATGGVVRGPYTGQDNLTASVKAGETILNHAQTQNVARLLDALEKSAGKGGGLVIAFNGPVYGDEERIATTVYDKIRSLQGEGRLAKW